jgi:GxxExxY protein
MNLLHKEKTYQIIGAAMEVHNELGCGFLEAVYQEAFEIELQIQKIPYEREKLLGIVYKNRLLKKNYSADFFCFGNIIVELKAISSITTADEAQTLNYLKATGMELGIILNFGSKSLQNKRLILR